MTGWIAFQFVFDIIIFALVIVFVLREAKTKKSMPTTEELHQLVQEFKDAVEKSEKVAHDLDTQLRHRKDALSSPPPPSPARTAPREQMEMKAVAKGDGRPPQGTPSHEMIEEHKRKVAALYRQGIPKDEISRRLAIPMPEVELIVTMLSAND